MKKLVKETEKLRKMLGKTKKDVADKAGVKEGTYQRWLDGESNPVGKYSKNLEEAKKELEEEMKDADITEEMHSKCVWEHQRYFGNYKTGCGEDFNTIAGAVVQFHYCPFCGKEIKIK